ncbi:MAG: DNA recombination protein RmuC [Actinomycetales bacterium]
MTGWTVLAALILGALIGAAVGAVLAAVIARARAGLAQATLLAERDLLAGRVATLEARSAQHEELERTMAPLSSSLARVERQVETLERERATQWGRLDAQLTTMATSGEQLRRQTAELAGALRSTGVRGTWGEVQLARIVEHAGLLDRVDIRCQADGVNDEGRAVRPDAVVQLPGGKQVVIDAKAPLAPDDDNHQAKLIRRHVTSLAAKRYWTAFDPSPELVVCFLPSEGLLSAACRADPLLVEEAMAQRVVLATPTTLLTMLRTVALTWQQDRLVGNAREVVELGRQLHERLVMLGGSTAKLGRTLARAVQDYNTLVTSTEAQVLSRARKLGELGVTSAEVPQLPDCEARVHLHRLDQAQAVTAELRPS